MEQGFVKVTSTSEIMPGKTKKFTVGDLTILIANVNGVFYAVDGLCTHYGGDLADGTLQDTVLTCPVHGAKFDVTNGKVVLPPTEPLDRPEIENLTVYPVKVEGHGILIKLSL